MLLRSASTPLFKSSLESDLSHRTRATRPIPMTLSSKMKTSRISSESDLRWLSVSKKKIFSNVSVISPVLVEEEGGEMGLSSDAASLLGDGSVVVEGCGFGVEENVVPAGVVGGGGGSVYGGNGGGGAGGAGGEGYEVSGQGNESMDGYYQKMIEAYPGDPLILGNYARFLKEVRGDVVKAEEYCERAILAKPNDGNVLTMYGDLIWNNHKDGSRAESYFDQAVQSAPDDCYVLASHARFLWDAEEGGEEQNEQEAFRINSTKTCISQPNLSQACGA